MPLTPLQDNFILTLYLNRLCQMVADTKRANFSQRKGAKQIYLWILIR